jgi:hypothetical protein
VDGGVVFHGDRFSEVDDRAAHRSRHAVERLDPAGDELGQLVNVSGLRPRDDVVGPARLAVSETPGKSRSAAATMAAWPASVWIRMHAAIT